MIASPASGSGKTTIAIGLMALFKSHGMVVQPYKCGPDYIDTKFHGHVCGRDSVNLDTFMATPEHVVEVYGHYIPREPDGIAVVEGMMGLFDGYNRSKGSAAEIAQLLDLPVFMVVDASSAAYSLAPLLHGFKNFDRRVQIAGVIFNKVGSDRHKKMLSEVCKDVGLECLGYLPRRKELEQKSRYLGLDFTSNYQDINQLIRVLDENIFWRRMLEITYRSIPTLEENWIKFQHSTFNFQLKKILIARNEESFTFIYKENLDLFARLGEVQFFNPEEDKPIPTDVDLLYLPGGYPEKHLEALSAAKTTLTSINAYCLRAAEGKGPIIIAECGGLIYLCKSVLTDNEAYPLVGAINHNISVRNADCHLSLGYREVKPHNGMFCGKVLRGHEFHYTQFDPSSPLPHSDAIVYDARGQQTPTPFISRGGMTASYTHLYLSSLLP